MTGQRTAGRRDKGMYAYHLFLRLVRVHQTVRQLKLRNVLGLRLFAVLHSGACVLPQDYVRRDVA